MAQDNVGYHHQHLLQLWGTYILQTDVSWSLNSVSVAVIVLRISLFSLFSFSVVVLNTLPPWSIGSLPKAWEWGLWFLLIFMNTMVERVDNMEKYDC